MGSVSSCEDAKRAVVDAKEEVEEQVTEAAGAIQEIAHDASNGVAQAATDVADATADLVEIAADKAAETMEAVQEKAEDVVDAAKAAVTGDQVDVKPGLEPTSGTMEAAASAVRDVLVVEFVESKGTMRLLEFKSRDLGFELAISSGGCCGGKAAQAKVAVSKLRKGGQAEKLGVKRSWALKHVNGTEVTGLAQARVLLAEQVAKLPEA